MNAEPVADQTGRAVRCASGELHFKVIDGDRIEIKCGNRHCTGGDSVVLHRFSFEGEHLETLKFKDPFSRGHGARRHRKDAP